MSPLALECDVILKNHEFDYPFLVPFSLKPLFRLTTWSDGDG